MSLDTSVLLLAWRRPETTRQVIDAIRGAAPSRMFLACDGPRHGRPDDDAAVQACRELMERSVDWPCTIERRYRESNAGCRAGVSGALDWFYGRVDAGIVLEDDCVPHQDFLMSLGMRLRDAQTTAEGSDLLNIFVQEGNTLFDAPPTLEESVLLGEASVLADKPEFASGDAMRKLLELTDTRTQLAALLLQRATAGGILISIGSEHGNPLLGGLTVVTAEYRAGALNGVIGVIGPTRMPYEKVIAVVRHASQLVAEVLA